MSRLLAALLCLGLAACVERIHLGDTPRDGGASSDGGAPSDGGGGSGDAGPRRWESLTVTGAEDIEWRSIHGDTNGRIWVAGTKDTVARLDGASWTVYHGGVLDDFSAIFAVAPDEVFAVGRGGLAFRFDGNQWAALEAEIASTLRSDLKDIDFSSVSGVPGGDVVITSNGYYAVGPTNFEHAVLRGRVGQSGDWEWFAAELEGVSSAFAARGPYAVGSDDLWFFAGSTYSPLRKPYESEYNAFQSMWLTGAGQLALLAHPSSIPHDQIYLSTGAGWAEVRDIDPALSLLNLGGDDQEALFVAGSRGYLGEVVGGALVTRVAEDASEPVLFDLYVAKDMIWAVGGNKVLRAPR